jgi:adenosylcobinamide-GDP ribazoletransferase
MKKEIHLFFTAMMFYTRIPCPPSTSHAEDDLNQATRYFPLIGWLVGGGSALVMWLAHFLFPSAIVALLGMATSILMTGAFHEDGFADACDGFGGGWTKAKILDIMKDSRIGAYGVVGILVLFGLKITALAALCDYNFVYAITASILAHVLSRFTALSMIFTHEYARDDATSKVKPIAKKLSWQGLAIGAIWLIPAFFICQNPLFLWVLVPVFMAKAYLARYFSKWVGGYTGDCLGATQQATEVITLLFALALCKFI